MIRWLALALGWREPLTVSHEQRARREATLSSKKRTGAGGRSGAPIAERLRKPLATQAHAAEAEVMRV